MLLLFRNLFVIGVYLAASISNGHVLILSSLKLVLMLLIFIFTGPIAMDMSIVKTYIRKETVSLVNGMLERLNISVWYCFRSFVTAVESIKTLIRRIKPVKVVPSITYPSAAEPCLIKQ